MIKDILMKSFVMREGERYCLLVEPGSGIPLFYPNLFVTTQVRNRSLSYSSMESALGGISVLLRFMVERNESLENRFSQFRFFEVNELDAIRDYCQIKFSIRSTTENKNGIFTLKELLESDEKVSPKTVYIRLTAISQYVQWLAALLTGESRDRATTLRINKMVKGLEARKPIKRNRNNGLIEKSVNEKQLATLFELFRPESMLNPFDDESVKVRNRLMFLLLYHLGLRVGELLNIRIQDISFTENLLHIKRRADEKDDPRTMQPLAKTRDRYLPLKDTLVKEIHNYIIKIRKTIVKPRQPDYLFVTHKTGLTKGYPISKSSYKKIISIVRKVAPELYDFTGHKLRHYWNEQFSELMDSMDDEVTEDKQEEIRSYLMGWIPGSGTAAIYNQRFIRKKGHEAALRLQDGMVCIPKDMSNE